MTELNPQLLFRCKQGDQQAFRELIHHYEPLAYAISFRILADSTESEDVVQECFIRIWKHLPELKEGLKFSRWMYRIVVNLCYDRLKARKRMRTHWITDSEAVENAAGPESDPGRTMDQEQLGRRIKQLAEQLTPKQRLVFILRDIQDLSVDEVSHLLSISSGSVKSNLYHARKKIRSRLEQLNLI